MTRLLPLAALAFALAGCKTVPEPPVEVREVVVPTPVTCIDPAEIPAEPPTVSRRFNGDAKHDLAILAPSAQALRKWGQDMRVLLDRCIAQVPAEAAGESSGGEGG